MTTPLGIGIISQVWSENFRDEMQARSDSDHLDFEPSKSMQGGVDLVGGSARPGHHSRAVALVANASTAQASPRLR